MLPIALLTSTVAAAISRRAVVTCGASSCAAAALLPTPAIATNAFAPPPERKGLQSRWLESVRIFLQDEADAVQYGGQEALAPGGPPAANPGLRLIPIVQMQATLRKAAPMVEDFEQWSTLRQLVTTGSFETREFKRIFNLYADNIYYTSETAEANAYLLGGATPSTSQTTQYLLRNEALKQLGELSDEIVYQQGLTADKRETEVAREYMQKLLKVFDEYLALAPPAEAKFARDAIYGPGEK